MAELIYIVEVTFPDQATAERWLDWIRAGHAAEVIAGGATSAEVVRLVGDAIAYAVVYRFPSRDVFAAYERGHAPRLREEGRRLFPPANGIGYRRTVAEVIS
jgi:hypothetical protein